MHRKRNILAGKSYFKSTTREINDIFPNLIEKITQEEIATYQMIEWLCFPSELGCEPEEIKIIDKLEKNGYCYYIFSFKSPTEISPSKSLSEKIQGLSLTLTVSVPFLVSEDSKTLELSKLLESTNSLFSLVQTTSTSAS